MGLKNIANRATQKTSSKGQGFPAKLTNTAARSKRAGGSALPSGSGGQKAPKFGKTTMGGPLKGKPVKMGP